jgi:hypothetical protein
MTKQSEAASSTQPETKMSDAELLEKQREIIVNLRLEKHEFREQAIAALRKATGCAFVVCEDLLANAYQGTASRTVARPTEFVTSSTVAGWGGGEREPLPDCPGCTDPRSEGTHSFGTKQHPEPSLEREEAECEAFEKWWSDDSVKRPWGGPEREKELAWLAYRAGAASRVATGKEK